MRMPPPPTPGRAARSRRHRTDTRRRRLALLVALALIATVTALVTAFGGGGNPSAPITAPAAAARLLPAGPPAPEALARLGALTLNLPVNRSRVTAIGYYAASDGALGLTPVGNQANQGLLKRVARAVFGGGSGGQHWYLLPGGDGPSTSALDVGAPPGTDVYAPVDGTVVGIEKVTLDGKVHGEKIDLQPTQAPSLVVSVANIAADPSLTVGASITAGSTKLGTLLDLARVETQTLARYTNDAGNHVLIEVHAAATLAIR